MLSAVAVAVLIHALTVSHRTYDDRFMLYFRSRQLAWQRYYQRHDYFLGVPLRQCHEHSRTQTISCLHTTSCLSPNYELQLRKYGHRWYKGL